MNKDTELPVRRRNDRLVDEALDAPRPFDPIIGYAQEPLMPLADACAPLVALICDIMKYIATAIENTPADPANGLTRDESASIRLYTMEWITPHGSLYSILNNALKTAAHKDLQPWFKYLKLLLTALTKIPCAPSQTIWRGVRKNKSDEFACGAPVTWWAFSSCTTTLTVLESELFFGKTGERTLFSIEVINGRNIRAHSQFDTEDEILMLPGTHMEVRSRLNPARGLYIIHLKQKVPKDVLLEPPFEGIMTI